MKTLAWDVDDVLNNLMRDWFRIAWLPKNPRCEILYDQIRDNPPEKILGIPRQTYLDSLDDFRREHGPSLSPSAPVLEWFRAHGHRFRHIALTTTPLHMADISAAWVMKNFGNWIRSFNVVPSPRANASHVEYDITKADFLEWLGAPDIMIDDNPQTIAEISRRSKPTLLWPQPWNGNRQTPAAALESLAQLNL